MILPESVGDKSEEGTKSADGGWIPKRPSFDVDTDTVSEGTSGRRVPVSREWVASYGAQA
jgi:hypothetical protein